MITDIQTLGTEYTITDRSGMVIKSLRFVPHDEIIEAILGEYSEEHGSFSDYLKKSLSLLCGYELVNYNKVLWFSTTDDEVTVKEIVEMALAGDYDFVILEKLDEVYELELM